MGFMTIKLRLNNTKRKLSTLMNRQRYSEMPPVILSLILDSKTIIKALSAKGRNPSKNVHVGNLLINKNSLGVSYTFAGPP